MKQLVITFLLVAFSAFIIFAQDYKEVEETFSIDPNGSVSVDTYKGSIVVETWDKNEVYIHAKMEPDLSGWDNTDPEEQLDNVEVGFRSSDDWVSVKSDYDKTDSWFGSNTLALVHYTIKMPKTAELVIDDYKSRTEVSNLSSKIRMETYKGRVDIRNLNGSIKLDTYKGDVEIEFVDMNNDCEFDTYKGNFKVYLPSDEKFSLDLDMGKKGDFYSDFDLDKKSRSGKWYRDEIRGDVNGGRPYIEFSTYKGDLEIRTK